ncbi:MAG TPA: GldG family protein [Candidatus Limiplasma sp.]|nr:GldG family protein [Candidatus Limiplasma sp.]
MNKQHKASVFQTRRFKSGGYAVLVSVIVVLVVVAVNIFVGQLPTTATKIDTTAQKLFTFSEQTEQLLKNLNENITLTLVAEKGSEDATTLELLNRYKALSDKITVNTVDPVVQPKFTAKYTTDDVAANSVIVESSKRNKVVANDAIYLYDYSNYYTTGSYDVSFAGESALTSAIDYVVSDNLPTVYQLQGHGETAVAGTLKTAVDNANLTIKDLSLLALDAVPDDCSTLLIYAPTSDLNSEEVDKIIAYMDKGGRLLLITDYTDTSRPNLKKLVNNYGVDMSGGIVVEGDLNHCLRGYQHYLLPTVNAHDITQPIKDGNLYVLMPISEGIVKLPSYRSSLTITSLLTTSDQAYNKANPNSATTMDKQDGDTSGPFDVGVAISETVADKETRMVWFPTSQFLVDQINEMVSGANQDLFINSLNWMCERENSISISAKNLSQAYLTVPSGSASIFSALLAVVLPLGVLAIGIFVVLKRRKR